MRQIMRHLVTCLLIIVSPIAAGSASADQLSGTEREHIRNTLKQAWESVEHLQLTIDEFAVLENAQRNPDPDALHIRWNIAMASGGRRAVSALRLSPKGPRRDMVNFREDGRRTYLISTFPDDPSEAREIHIRAQSGSETVYNRAMNIFLWLYMPAGRPLFAHIDAGSKLERSRNAAGELVTTLTIIHHQVPMPCVLDGGHDWLPRQVSTPKGEMSWTATKFERVDGHWFPVEGHESHLHGKNVVKPWRGMHVTHIRVNEPIRPSEFVPAMTNQGLVIRNEVNRKTDIVGGLPARDRLESRHLQQHDEALTQGHPTVASRSPSSLPWSAIIATASLTVLGIALFSRVRRSRRN